MVTAVPVGLGEPRVRQPALTPEGKRDLPGAAMKKHKSAEQVGRNGRRQDCSEGVSFPAAYLLLCGLSTVV